MAKKQQQRPTEKAAAPQLWSVSTPRLPAPFRALVPIFLLVLLPTLLLWSVTVGGKTLVPTDLLLLMSPWRHFVAEKFPEVRHAKAPLLDVLQQYAPWRKFYAETLRQGELPLWNPYMFCGTSFVGNGMSAIFYPPNLLFAALPVKVAFGWVAWLHLVLAGLFMFGFLRQFLPPLAALTGSIVFQLYGFFIAWLAYLPLPCTAIWLPAALGALEKAWESKERGSEAGRGASWVWMALAAGALGMALLAGHPQVGFYVLWAFGVYVVLKAAFLGLSGAKDGWRALAIGGLLLVAGIFVGAPQLLPLLEMARVSFRSASEALAAAALNQLPLDQFIRLFVPSFFGDWRSGTHFLWDFARFNFVERTGYPGVIAFLLAFVGLTALRTQDRGQGAGERERRWQWLAWVGVVFALVGLFAASVPIVHRFMAVGLPLTQAFVGISRALFLFDFGIALLSAIGVAQLAQQKVERLPLTILLGTALLLMAGCVSYGIMRHAATAFHPLLRDFTLAQLSRWLAFTAIGVLLLWLLARFPPLPSALRSLLLALCPLLVAVDLLSFAWGQHPEGERDAFFFATPSIRWLQQHLGSQRFVAVGTDAIKHWTPSNTLMAFGLRDAQGSDSLMTIRIFRFLQTWDKNSPLHLAFAVRNFDSPLLDLMAVRYIVAAEPLSASERKSLRLVHAGDLWVYENPDALPRAFVIHKWRWVKTAEEALRLIASPQFRPQQWAVLEGARSIDEKSSSLSEASAKRKAPQVQLREGINLVRCEVMLPQAGALLLADGVYPGWRAFVSREKRAWSTEQGAREGWRAVPIFVADYAFRAVLLPKGRWQVVWVYFPSSVIVGLFLCLLAVGGMLASAAGFALWRWERRHFKPQSL